VSRIVCVGEAFVDLFADEDVTDIGASKYFQRAAGGAVANVAVGIARLEGSAAFVGTLGRDPFGRYLVQALARENVDIDGVRSVDAPTPVVFVARGAHGAREFYPMFAYGADTMLEVADLDRSTFERALAVQFGGVVLAREPGRGACMTAAAYGNAGLVSFDPNVRTRLFQSETEMRRVMLAAFHASHLVKCSDEDLNALGMDVSVVEQLLTGATQAVVVTHGEAGCTWMLRGGRSGRASSPHITPVDTTGAGDAFMAALLWRMVYHHRAKITAESLEEASRFAVAAGALACASVGAIASLPRASELELSVKELQP
jgi:fructokinase